MMNRENLYEIPATSNTGSEFKESEGVKKGKDIKKCNKQIYFAAIFIILIAVVGCFIALFLEVAKLKSETSPVKFSLQQINESLEERFQIFTDNQGSATVEQVSSF